MFFICYHGSHFICQFFLQLFFLYNGAWLSSKSAYPFCIDFPFVAIRTDGVSDPPFCFQICHASYSPRFRTVRNDFNLSPALCQAFPPCPILFSCTLASFVGAFFSSCMFQLKLNALTSLSRYLSLSRTVLLGSLLPALPRLHFQVVSIWVR